VSFTPTYTRSNVLVGQAQAYLQPYNASSPATLPAATVQLGTAWGGSWVPVGATDSGLEFDFQRKPVDIMIEEQQTPVQVVSDSTDVEVPLTLAEDTLQTMLWAMGGGTITTTTPSGETIATLVITSDIGQFSLGFEGMNQYGFFRRVLLQPCVSVGQAKVAYRRSKDKRMWDTSFTYLDKLENMVIQERQA
jgi:hypothetical protein